MFDVKSVDYLDFKKYAEMRTHSNIREYVYMRQNKKKQTF